jgi:hypothetical protein
MHKNLNFKTKKISKITAVCHLQRTNFKCSEKTQTKKSMGRAWEFGNGKKYERDAGEH